MGGGSTDNSGDPSAKSANYVLLGDITQPRLSTSDLAPYIAKHVTKTVELSDFDNIIPAIDALNEGDILFFGNADEDPPDIALLFKLYDSVLDAYKRGVTFALIYPDSADVATLEGMLGLKSNDISLSKPNDEAEDVHFEILAVAERELPNGTLHTFVYIDDNSKNYGGIVDVEIEEISIDVAIESGDFLGGDGDTHDGDTSGSESSLTTEEVKEELNSMRVQNLIDWHKELDEDASKAYEKAVEASAKLKAAASTEKDILELISGVTTTQPDEVSWSFIDYYKEIGKKDDDFNKFADKCDFDNERLLKKYWSDFKVSRRTFSKYRVLSFHSFEDHNDYYLVLSEANTQPRSLLIAADKGTNNHDEVPGAGAYNYAVILGYTRGLYTRVRRYYAFGNSVHHLPNQTVNKNKSYTDTNGWSLTGGVSFKAGASEKTGPYAEVGTSFSATVSHQSSTTWQTQDYEVIPLPSEDRVDDWLLRVERPTYSKGWHISTAAQDSVTLETESIWKSDRTNFELEAKAYWYEGFAYCHDTTFSDSVYQCSILHGGSAKMLNLPRPPRIALSTTSENGTKDGKMYSTKLYTEGNWTATTDVDWISLENSSGGTANGFDFYYAVSPNDTGKIRTGYITVTSDNGSVVLRFAQSPY